jgi:hypothetical protein
LRVEYGTDINLANAAFDKNNETTAMAGEMENFRAECKQIGMRTEAQRAGKEREVTIGVFGLSISFND